MFFTDPADDDDDDFTPSSTASSKLPSLFGGTPEKSPSLKYVAPKQPRSDRADSAGSAGAKSNSPAPSGQQTTTQTATVILASPVHAYLYVNGEAQSQGRVMSCILGNFTEKNFQLLLYRSKQNHLTRARIHQHFSFTVLPNNYGNFIDDQQRNWSIMLETGHYVDFIIQMGICRALVGAAPGGVVTQDVTVGEGYALQEGDQAQVSVSTFNITSGKKGDQVSIHFLFSNRLFCMNIFIICPPPTKGLGNSLTAIQVFVQVKASMASSFGQIVYLNTKEHIKDDGGPSIKASLVSRMARVGHPLLPTRPSNTSSHPTDSESEVEEISRQKHNRHNSSSMSGSTEELAATPAIRSRAPSTRSDTIRPEPAPRPSHLSSHPQQMVVYQPAPWQQHGIVGPGYSMAAGASVGTHIVPPQQVAPVADPTLSLLFSETRSQNTELKISVSKMSDKIDNLMNKIEKMEQQQQQHYQEAGGAFAQSAIVASRMMHPYQEQQPFHCSALTSDPRGLLAQITTLVSENEEMKSRLEDKEKTVISLNNSVTQLLQKNQKLLEEKTDMLVAKQQQAEEAVTSVSITELLNLREEKATIAAQLSLAQNQCASFQDELSRFKASTETQQRDIQDLKTQIQLEQAKGLQHQEKLLKENNGLEEKLQSLQLEKDSMKRLLDTTMESQQTLQKELSGMTDKKTNVEQQLQIVRTECEKLKMQAEDAESRVQSLMQQVKEEKVQRNSAESRSEMHFKSQHEEILQTQKSRISQLEQKVLQLQSYCSEIEEEKVKNISIHEIQLQKLAAQKTSLEEMVQQLQKVTPNQSSPTKSPEVTVEMVKKVMNVVYRTLKAQFLPEKMYSGSEVLQALLSVIRETTLKLVEDLQKTNSTAESSLAPQDHMSSESTTTLGTKGKSDETNLEKSNRISGQVKSNINDVKNQSKANEELKRMETKEQNAQKEEKSASTKNSGEDTVHKGDVAITELKEDLLSNSGSKDETTLSLCESIDSRLGNCSHKMLVNNTVSRNINDCQTLSPPNSLGNEQKGDGAHGVIQAKENEEEPLKSIEDSNKELRHPVIDMENTEVRKASEKSDSSRDSSLEREWRPRPPTPPLFGDDDDDDDDWLS
ncbi:FK506-binding protein 15-like [Cherax quadricarinatus]